MWLDFQSFCLLKNKVHVLADNLAMLNGYPYTEFSVARFEWSDFLEGGTFYFLAS